MRRHVLGLKQERLATAIEVGADDGKASQRDPGEVIGHEVEELRVGAGNTRMHAALRLHARTERGGRTLELLVRDEALDQDLAERVSVEPVELVIQLLIVTAFGGALVRDERCGLDVEEGGGNQQEVARNIEVESLQALNLGEVLLGHLRDGDGPDVDLLTAHELQKQVEGARVPLR